MLEALRLGAQRIRFSRSVFALGCLLPAGLLAASLFCLLYFSIELDAGLWAHLWQHRLLQVAWDSLFLLFSVSLCSLVLGLSFAYLVVFVSFPGRMLFEKLLALPLAVPSYVFAFVWIGLLDFAGPVQSLIREGLGWSEFDLSVRNRFGISAVLSLSLYPYVYLLAREAFSSQGPRMSEVARSLGVRSKSMFFRLHVAFARPWIVAGLTLVALECLSDFGAVMAFNYETWTVLIYRTWFDHFSLSTAAQLCLIQLGAIFLLLILLQVSRGQDRYESTVNDDKRAYHRSEGNNWWITIILSGFLLIVLGLPMFQLIVWSFQIEAWHQQWAQLAVLLRNTFLLAFAAGVLVVLVSALAAAAERFFPRRPLFVIANRISLLGYAFPGTVLAVAFVVGLTLVFGPLSQIAGLSLTALVVALAVRYFSVGFRSLRSAYERLPKRLDEASESLGCRGWQLFQRLHFPLIQPAALSAFFLVFMDVAKEMPLQVMIRPFGWQTLSTQIFQYTVEGEWQRAAAPSLILVFLSVGLGFLLKPSIDWSRRTLNFFRNREIHALPQRKKSIG